MQQTKTLVLTVPYLEPHRPPISSAILCEIARLAGHDVRAKDLNIIFYNHNKDKWLDSKTKTYSTDYLFENITPNILYDLTLSPETLDVDWILISQLTIFEFSSVLSLCKWLKGKTRAKIVVGGPGIESKFNSVDTCGNFLYTQKLVDYYIFGEAEVSLFKLFEGNVLFPGINGTSPDQINDIENLPLPNYDLYNLDLYDYPFGKNERDFYIYGSRGCVKNCTFCDIQHYWPKFKYRSGASIANEMISNYKKYGTRNFYFADSLINGNLKEFKIFCQTLINFPEAKNFKWSGFFVIRPKSSHTKEFFDMIKDAGGYYLNVGVETGVDRIRFEMKKQISNDDIEWHLENCSRLGLTNQFQFITSWPTETIEEHQEYLTIFSKWRPYVADGTISSASLNGPMTMLDGSPIVQKSNNPDTQLSKSKMYFWIHKENKNLTVPERYRRTVNIIKEARKNRWPLDRIDRKLIEWTMIVKKFIEEKNEN